MAYFCWGAGSLSNRAQEIVQRSVANTNADWDAAPQYHFTERDVVTRHGRETDNTFQVVMIEGSPYKKLSAIDGEPIPATQAAIEDHKLQQETDKRRNESPAAKQSRVADYERERRQDHALMTEMMNAFHFELEGDDTVNGRRCFVLKATPKPGYTPSSRETEVLKGMHGKMWVDEEEYQWVKVHAEVFHPVSFGLFFASVKPGTEFTLEQDPVQENLWLPSHFRMEVNARVLLWSHRSSDDETYSNYHRSADVQANATGMQPTTVPR